MVYGKYIASKNWFTSSHHHRQSQTRNLAMGFYIIQYINTHTHTFRRRRGGHLRNAPHHGYSGNNSPSTGRAMSNESTDSTKQMLAVPMRPAGLGATHHHMFASQQQQLDHHAGVHQQQLQQKQQMIGGG